MKNKDFANQIKKEVEKNSYYIAQKIIENEVANYLKNLMIERVEPDVYNKYNPKYYQRRKEQGGLLDKQNISHSLTFDNGEFTLRVINSTPFNFAKSLPKGFKIDELSKFINNGDETSNLPFKKPRPFLDNTGNDEKWKEIFNEAMSKHGFD